MLGCALSERELNTPRTLGFRRFVNFRPSSAPSGSEYCRWMADVDWDKGEGVVVLWKLPFMLDMRDRERTRVCDPR